MATQSTGQSVTSLFGQTADTLVGDPVLEIAADAPAAIVLPSPSPALDTWDFGTCGQSGPDGPGSSQCMAAYAGTSLDGQVSVDMNRYQLWTVPYTGTYRIEAFGAAGGDGQQQGGFGARVEAQFSLIAGQQLKLAIGQRGGHSGNSAATGNAAGGGGASFVVNDTTGSLLLAAGGGGGAGVADGATALQQAGMDGLWNSEAGSFGNATTRLAPGSNGNGAAQCDGTGASGGAGYLTGSVAYTASSWATAASAFNAGAMGATQRSQNGGDGGFGGGGAGGYGGGGGGGYSGGGCGDYQNYRDTGGGGGGSYINSAGSGANGDSGFNPGHGQIIIRHIN